jgi:polyferredoxin
MKIAKRRWFQAGGLLLFHLPFLGALSPAIRCVPVFSCHACALTWNICPIGALMHYSGWHLIPYYLLGLLFLFGATIGRLFCGWICPFGTLQALLYRVPSPKFKLPAWAGYGKYLFLLVLVILLPFFWGELTYYSFCRICPAAALQVVIPNWLTSGFYWDGWLSAARFLVLGAVVVLAIASSRSFCKVMCPIGAMMGPFNHVSLWRVPMPYGKCPQCGKCDAVCPTDVKPSERLARDTSPNRHDDCIVCHECAKACPVMKKLDQKKTEGVATHAGN